VWLARSRARWGALLIAALTVAVGCLPLGAGTLVGALVGIAVGSAPFLVNQRG
jgi:hypothetical protein